MLVKGFCYYFNSQEYVRVQCGRKEGTYIWAQIAAPPLRYHLALAKWFNYRKPQFDFILNRFHKTYFAGFVLSNGDTVCTHIFKIAFLKIEVQLF